MILDNEQQRAILIEVIEASTVSGKTIRPLAQLLYQIETAQIAESNERTSPRTSSCL